MIYRMARWLRHRLRRIYRACFPLPHSQRLRTTMPADKPTNNDIDTMRWMYYLCSEVAAPDASLQYIDEFVNELDRCLPAGGAYRNEVRIAHRGKTYRMTIRIQRDWM